MERPNDPLAVLPDTTEATLLTGHVLIVGHGRVGRRIADALSEQGIAVVVAEQNRETVEGLRGRGIPAVSGDAAEPAVLIQAHVARARMLVIAMSDSARAQRMIETAHILNSAIEIIVLTHSDEEAKLLQSDRPDRVFIGETELASGMTQYVLDRIKQGGDGKPPVTTAA
jgi:CPA2 family monovalent cation:H+ antiporter-2